MIIETFRQALQNVWSNKLRTFLTMLGIIIGVMAVIVIVGLGNGMTQSMRDSFSALGVPVFVVIYAGLERLVDHGLKKRGLQTETAEYMDLDYIDDATMQPVRLPQEVPDESLKDPKDDSVK